MFSYVHSLSSFLFCDEMRRECDEIWFYVKKTRFNTGQEQRTETLATFRSTTELLPLIKKHYKTTIFYKQEFEKSRELMMNCAQIALRNMLKLSE